MPELLSSKLSPPYAGTTLIERPRLVNLIARGETRKATLLTAPAGYGKTALMRQLAAHIGKPLVWYQLDEYDNDPALFLQYLVAGIQRHIPGFGAEILHLIAQGDIATRQRLLVIALVNSLAEQASSGMVIALDDYHLIHNPLINNFVLSLLNSLPAGVHVIIATRTALPFSICRLSLQGLITSFDMEALRFSRQEIAAFLSINCPGISEKAIEMLEHKTNGWPIALGLAGESPFTLNGFLVGKDTQKVYDFLATEVFDRQPQAIQEFLLATGVLEVMTPTFCDRLLARTDSDQVLNYLKEQQLFLIPLAGQQKAYRYHHLFRDFLQNRLGNKRQALQKRAGELAREAGEPDQAIEYFMAAGSHADVLSLIKEASPGLFRRGCWQTVARWLKPLTKHIPADPWLCLFQAKIEAHRGLLDEAEMWAMQAATQFAENNEEEGLKETRLLQARILRGRGRHADSLNLLEQISPQAANVHNDCRFDLAMEKSLSLFFTGNFDEAEKVLSTSYAAAQQNGDTYAVVYALEGLGNIYYVQGNYSKALQAYRRAADLLPERVVPSFYMQDNIPAILQDWGELEQAMEHAKRSVAVRETFGFTEALPSAYAQLASLYTDRSEWELAEKYYNQAILLIREHNGDRFFLALNLVLLAQCLGLQNRWIEARVKAEEALSEARRLSGMALLVCQVVSSPIFAKTGSIREAKEMGLTAINQLEQIGFKKALCYGYTFQAWLYLAQGEMGPAREYTRKSLQLAAKLNDVQTFLTHHATLYPVLKLGLVEGIEVTFIQRILIRLGERALPLLLELADHQEAIVRLQAIAPLIEIGGTQAKNAVRSLLSDTDSEVRQAAWLATPRLDITTNLGDYSATTGKCLHFVTLGIFRLFKQGTEVSDLNWRTAKTRDLLAYLVHVEEPVSKERILEDLWPEDKPDNANAIFHTTLYYLRQFLDKIGYPNSILYSGKRYQLRPDFFSCDRQKFQNLLSAGLHKNIAPEESVIHLEEAVKLYNGDYLEQLDYLWLIPCQENLRRCYVKARISLAKYYLHIGEDAKAISHLQFAEDVDPLGEEIHTLLMTAYARQGNKPAIKTQYEKFKNLWHKELGLSPSPEIRDLFLKLNDLGS